MATKTKADPDRRKAFSCMLLMAVPVVLAVLFSLYLRSNIREAEEAVVKLGGTINKIDIEGGPRLSRVDLHGRPVTDSDLAALRPKFKKADGPVELDLSGTKITDAGLEHLAGLSQLSSLKLDDTAVNGKGFLNLKGMGWRNADEANVELSLARTQVDDAGLAGIGAIAGLEKLNLAGTKVTGAGLVYLQMVPHLMTLNLDACAIDDAALVSLAALKKLEFLSLNGTRVTDVVWIVRELPKLERVSVQGTGVTAEGVGEMKKAKAGLVVDK